MGAAELISLALGLLQQSSAIMNLIQTAQAEKRDITKAEVDAVLKIDDEARKALVDDIARRVAAGDK